MPLSTIESPSSIETKQTIAAIEEVKAHPFEFGFRYPIKNGLAKLEYSGDYKSWGIRVKKPRISDPIWYGNCVEDSTLSADYIRENTNPPTLVTIQRLEAKGMGNFPGQTDHYRVFVEHPSAGSSVLEFIDHSSFHEKYLGPDNIGIRKWYDLNKDDEEVIRSSTNGYIDRSLYRLAFCEFRIGNFDGIAYLGIVNERGDNSFNIKFDLVMPDREPDSTVFSVSTSIPFGIIDKQQLATTIDVKNFKFIDEKGVEIIELANLNPMLKEWFKEIIPILPDFIKPKKNRFFRR